MFDMKSLLSGSNVTSDVLAQYQSLLSKQHPDIYFVPPVLFHLLSMADSPPDQLAIPNFDKYRFVFWPVNIVGKTKSMDHWVTALHSTRDNAHVYYLDTLGEKAAIEARLPTNILATINCFLAQQNPPRVVSSVQILNTHSNRKPVVELVSMNLHADCVKGLMCYLELDLLSVAVFFVSSRQKKFLILYCHFDLLSTLSN